MEILIIHPGGLGDVVLSLPAVALLRNEFPAARVTVAGNIDHLVPVMSGYAERIISLSALPLHHLYAPGSVPESVVKFWRSYDRIVSWTGGGDREFTRKFKEIHPNVIVASWRPAPGEAKHVSQLFVDSLAIEDGAAAKAVPTPVLLNSNLRAEGKEWLVEHGWNGRDSLTALHPGAGSKAKRWPISRFISLAQHLALQEKRKLLIIEGSAERGLAEQIVSALPADAGNCIGRNVPESARRCRSTVRSVCRQRLRRSASGRSAEGALRCAVRPDSAAALGAAGARCESSSAYARLRRMRFRREQSHLSGKHYSGRSDSKY